MFSSPAGIFTSVNNCYLNSLVPFQPLKYQCSHVDPHFLLFFFVNSPRNCISSFLWYGRRRLVTHSHCLCQWLVLFVIFSSQLSYFSSSQKKDNSIYLTEIKNDYWMTLSEEWRMIKIDDGVVSRSQRLRRITPSEICINLCVVRKLNLVTVFFYSFQVFPNAQHR